MRVNVPNYSPILISSNYYFLEIMSHYRFMEKDPVIKLNEIITDTIWSCPAYHWNPYQSKKWSVVKILAHR